MASPARSAPPAIPAPVLTAAMVHTWTHPTSNHLAPALLLAMAVHGVLLLGVGFIPELQSSGQQHHRSLKVTLVRPRPDTPEPVQETDLAAQVSQQGSGEDERSEPAQSPLPAAAPVQPLPAPQPASPPPAVEVAGIAETGPTEPRRDTPAPRRTEPARTQPPARITAAQLLASRSAEVARLTAELDRKSAAYANRPRRKAISSSTTEYKYAAYLEAWRRKVERIGNLNYPDEARRQRLFGNLVLHVAVRPDGSVKRINLLHSSGHKVLDDAAMRIVRLAAPFAPFPPDIARDVDILDITRTWQFLSGNRLGSKD